MIFLRIDIMTDIETLGHKSDSTIIQISAMAFDIHTGKHVDEYNRIIDITKNKKMSVTGSTIKWWLNTNKDLLQKLINEGRVSSEDALVEFHTWLNNQIVKDRELGCDNNNVYLWGNGILFDNKMIQKQFEDQGLEYPIFYRNDRDVRTLVDLTSSKLGISEKELKEKFNDENLVLHNAIDDVKYQINLVVGCYEILTSK